MNVLWLVFVCASLGAAGFTGRLDALTGAMLGGAKGAIDLALALAGSLCLWLGILRVGEKAGVMDALGRAMLPIMRRLFPQVPAGHPAFGAMLMNLAANVLGMDNAATAFGLKAMRALDTLNRVPGVATDAMILFLAINTAGISAVPVNVVAARAAIDPTTAGRIVLPTMIVSVITTLTALFWVRLFERIPRYRKTRPDGDGVASLREMPDGSSDSEVPPAPALVPPSFAVRASVLALALFALSGVMFAWVTLARQDGLGAALRSASGATFVIFAAGMLIYGASRGVKVYEAAVEGARDGFDVAVRIMPYLVIILVAVGLLRASGLMDAAISALAPVSDAIGVPGAVLPQALVRPMSGSAAMGVLVDTLQREGPNSQVGFISSVIYGSSETTFYVLSVYFGAVAVRSLRHALIACLMSDLTGMLIAVWIARVFY